MIRKTILGLSAAAAILTAALAPSPASAGYYGYSSYGYSSYRSYDDCYTPKYSYGYYRSYGY
jgi:hypothetical protein